MSKQEKIKEVEALFRLLSLFCGICILAFCFLQWIVIPKFAIATLVLLVLTVLFNGLADNVKEIFNE